MSFINTVMLVGWLHEEPVIKTSQARKRYAVVKLQTGRPIRGSWVYAVHRVVVFEKAVIDMFERGTREGRTFKGEWFKVSGELTYLNGSSAQVVVDGVFGHLSRMFKDVWEPVEFETDEEIRAVEGEATENPDQANDIYDTRATSSGQFEDRNSDIPF